MNAYTLQPSSLSSDLILSTMNYAEWQILTTLPFKKGSKITVIDYQVPGNIVDFIKTSDTDHTIATGWTMQESGSPALDTSYEVLTFGTSVNIDVSKMFNNKYIEASGNFAIVMTNKTPTADGFEGEISIKKTTATNIVITLDPSVVNTNYSGGFNITAITVTGGLNIEERLKFKYIASKSTYKWEFLTQNTIHTKDITISGGGYTLSIADLDLSKNEQMLFMTTSGGNQDFIIPAGLQIPSRLTITVCQVTSTTLNIRKGNTALVVLNAAGGVNTVNQQSTIFLAGQNSMCNITPRGGDVYYINGDILQ